MAMVGIFAISTDNKIRKRSQNVANIRSYIMECIQRIWHKRKNRSKYICSFGDDQQARVQSNKTKEKNKNKRSKINPGAMFA